MDRFVPVFCDPMHHHRRRHPFREIFEPFERTMTPWFHTPHIFDPFDTLAVHTPWTFIGYGEEEPPDSENQAAKGEKKDTWETSLSLEGFDRDNVKVTALDDHSVLVEAKKVNVDEEGGQYEYQHLCRKLAVPENIDMKTVRVDLSDDGQMVLKAGPPRLTDASDSSVETSDVQAKDKPPKPSGDVQDAAPSGEGGGAQAVTQTTEHPVSNVEHGQDLNVKFNLKGYPPESIKVKVAGNRLSVHAKQEMKTEDGIVHRQFHQAITIPHHINPDNITSKLSADGQLSITAKRHEEREIEVQME